MKFTSSDIQNLLNILSTCAVGGIDSIVIDNETQHPTVRGINESKTFVIISTFDVPYFPQKIGLSRLNTLKQRLELFPLKSTSIEAKESDRGEISTLEIISNKNKMQFRCSSTMLIKAPKSINDAPVHRIFITKEELQLALNAIKVMSTKNVQLIIKTDRTVCIVLSDDVNDSFTTILENPSILLSEAQDSVVHYYQADIFHAVMKTHVSAELIGFEIGGIGALRTTVNGHQVIIMPKISDDNEEEE